MKFGRTEIILRLVLVLSSSAHAGCFDSPRGRRIWGKLADWGVVTDTRPRDEAAALSGIKEVGMFLQDLNNRGKDHWEFDGNYGRTADFEEERIRNLYNLASYYSRDARNKSEIETTPGSIVNHITSFHDDKFFVILLTTKHTDVGGRFTGPMVIGRIGSKTDSTWVAEMTKKVEGFCESAKIPLDKTAFDLVATALAKIPRL